MLKTISEVAKLIKDIALLLWLLGLASPPQRAPAIVACPSPPAPVTPVIIVMPPSPATACETKDNNDTSAWLGDAWTNQPNDDPFGLLRD